MPSIMLFPMQQHAKMDLIERNIHEKSTGMEVLKRLIRNGMLAEFPNQEDKRSKLVALTEQGRAEVLRVLEGMQKLTTTVNGDLLPQEILTLNALLKKLDTFHWQRFGRNAK
jgi:MarR family transcriptional regulator, lower aerobic nicotinate degradation pathway regulator